MTASTPPASPASPTAAAMTHPAPLQPPPLLLPALAQLPPDHFLSVPRGAPRAPGAVDTSTLAAHDFDVDVRTGFMPPAPPLARLPPRWERWEAALEAATAGPLQLGAKPGLTPAEAAASAAWRASVEQMPVLPTKDLFGSELLLRRAHHVLAWVMHFYIHTLPPLPAPAPVPPPPIVIPAPVGVPALEVSAELQLPPVLTYSDDVLYNWYLADDDNDTAPQEEAMVAAGVHSPPAPLRLPTPENIRCQTLFTGARDESEFYLASARIELRGVRALGLMRAAMDEAFVGDATALRRLTSYLSALAGVVGTLTETLLAVRDGCDPDVFYNEIRPWFKGEDSAAEARKWVFAGAAERNLPHPAELSGPSAGQSALVHALDIFLGVDQYSHAPALTGRAPHAHAPAPASPPHTPPPLSPASSASSLSSAPGSPHASPPPPHAEPSPTLASDAPAPAHPPAPGAAFLDRMQLYMPRHHRAFLRHLARAPHPLRALVEARTAEGKEPALRAAYNGAVRALKGFRDAHMRIVALYIIQPARRAQAAERERERAAAERAAAAVVAVTGVEEKGRWLPEEKDAPLKGTGGTELVRFLKGVRDRTAHAVLESHD